MRPGQLFTIAFVVTGILCSCSSKNKTKTESGKQDSINTTKLDTTDRDTESIFRRYDAVEKKVAAWNESINRNDMVGLGMLYADNIDYYRKSTTQIECINSKTNWLNDHPKYQQKIEDLQVYYSELDTTYSLFTAEFKKVCIDNGKTTEVNSFLHFKKFNGEWMVVGESDQPTEVLRAKSAKAITLPDGKYSFFRGYWLDTRNDESGIGHDQVPYRMELNITIGDSITGDAYAYSGMMRTTNEYVILEGKMENGILSLTVFFNGNSEIGFEEVDMNDIPESKKDKWQFKIVSENELFGLSKNCGYFEGYSIIKQ